MASGVTMVGAEVWAIVCGHRSFPNDGHAAPSGAHYQACLHGETAANPWGYGTPSPARSHPWGGYTVKVSGALVPAFKGTPGAREGCERSGAVFGMVGHRLSGALIRRSGALGGRARRCSARVFGRSSLTEHAPGPNGSHSSQRPSTTRLSLRGGRRALVLRGQVRGALIDAH
jgi:hypothetical protein